VCGGSVDTVVELVITTVVVTADVVGLVDVVVVEGAYAVDVDEAEVEDADEVNVVTADVTGIVVVSDDVAEEVTLVLEDVSLDTEDDSGVELVEIMDDTDVVDDDESVVSVDAEEDEITVESDEDETTVESDEDETTVESVDDETTDVVDVTDVDSVETVESGDVVEESVGVGLLVWKTLAALAVEPLKTRPNTARERITNRATRRLRDTPSRLLFIHPFFLRCIHLTMSCSWRINQLDESSLLLQSLGKA
jgi:hypothetical protein